VYAQLSAQQHRRFIKTHTPLDGIPLDEPNMVLVHYAALSADLEGQMRRLAAGFRSPCPRTCGGGHV
jgi:hypothetical protein